MIFIIIIFIMFQIDPSEEFALKMFKNNEDLASQAVQSGIISKWNEIGKLYQLLLFLAMAVELGMEVFSLVKALPHLITKSMEKRRNKPIYEADLIKSIDLKIAKGYSLTRKEQRFISKKRKK